MEYSLSHKVFSINPGEFEALSLEIFHFQHGNNRVYRGFCDALGVVLQAVKTLEQIPFLPISLFKTHTICTTDYEPEAVFESSGTTGSVNSRHFVKDLSLYHESFFSTFKTFYGDPKQWCILALLPAYLERQNSSLVVMADALIRESNHPQSGFYLYDHEALAAVLRELELRGQKTILLGVTFALLDFSAEYPMALKNTIVLETGGMKGRRKEMTRDEVHQFLKERMGVESIHAEYGMTELLSQAYSSGNGIYYPPAWMKMMIREEDDPLKVHATAMDVRKTTRSGVLNVIDLANIYSCSFIATDDMGKLYEDGSFEVLGRIDHSDIRGCSLMVALNRE